MDHIKTNNTFRETPQDGSAPLGSSDSNSGGHEPGKPRKFGPHDPERANHLKKYRWRKGIASPNPGGRPRALPISDRLRAALEIPLPTGELRELLEVSVGGKLPRRFTFGDAIGVMAVLGVLGEAPDFRADILREIRVSVEGKAPQRVEVVEEEEPRDPEEAKYELWAKMIVVAARRGLIYGMPMPHVSAIGDAAGVDFGLPREDKSTDVDKRTPPAQDDVKPKFS